MEDSYRIVRGLTVLGGVLRLPLDLGLRVETQSILRDAADELIGPTDVQTGDRQFDRMFQIAGDEPERVAALLGAPLRSALLRPLAAGMGVALSDLGVSLPFRQGDGASFDEQAERAAREVCVLLDARRDSIPEASALSAHRSPWGALAHAHGLAVGTTPLRISGSIGDLRVTATTERRARGVHRLEVRVGLAVPLAARLRVRPRGRRGLEAWIGRARRKAEPFARVFRVDASDADTRALLDAPLRDRLLSLAARGAAPRIWEQEVSIEAAVLPPDGAATVRLIEEGIAIADALRRAAVAGAARSPYR